MLIRGVALPVEVASTWPTKSCVARSVKFQPGLEGSYHKRMRIKIRPSHRHASIVAGKTRKPFCGVPLIPALSRAIFSGKETREANLLAFRGSVGIMEESIFQPYLGTRTIFKMDRQILRRAYMQDQL